MAKGAIAKAALADALAKALPQAYLGESGGKHYFEMLENGEMLQIAVSMTYSKTPVSFNTRVVVPNKNGGLDFENAETVVPQKKVAEISTEEKEYIAKLIKELGL